MENPLAQIPATLRDIDEIENDLCANPECGREVGLAGCYVPGKGRICGSCFRNMRAAIVMDENYEMSRIWRK